MNKLINKSYLIGEGLMIKTINLIDLHVGMTIAADVTMNGIVLAKKGVSVDKKLKELLKKWEISEVKIKVSDIEQDDNQLTQQKEEQKLYDQFRKLLPSMANEARYGFALHHDEDYFFVEELFVKFMNNQFVFKVMEQLKNHDNYSYLHSIDTFILGALFAKAMNLNDIEVFALGCLLHDIGKLQIPQKLLQKKGMLTAKEYTEIQKHVIYGHECLIKNNFHNLISELARSHHERIDGTGYPDQLTEKELSQEIEMLMIIDVYSALTLPRAYHEGRSALAAIKVFIKEDQRFNQNLVYSFLELLKIFPATTTVSLSNKKKAKILYVNEKQPCLPLVEIIETKETFQLPINYSLYIEKINKLGIGTEKEQQKSLWNDYLSALVSGQKDKAIHLFDELIDNRRLEDIYLNIISSSMKEIGDGWKKGQLSIAEEHVASFITMEILDYFKYKSVPIPTEKRPKIATLTVEGEKHTLPLKITVDILEAKGWHVYNLERPLPANDLLKFLVKNSIDKLGISITLETLIPNLNKLISDIKKVNDKITIIIGGAAANSKEINGADVIVTDIDKFDEAYSN